MLDHKERKNKGKEILKIKRNTILLYRLMFIEI